VRPICELYDTVTAVASFCLHLNTNIRKVALTLGMQFVKE